MLSHAHAAPTSSNWYADQPLAFMVSKMVLRGLLLPSCAPIGAHICDSRHGQLVDPALPLLRGRRCGPVHVGSLMELGFSESHLSQVVAQQLSGVAVGPSS